MQGIPVAYSERGAVQWTEKFLCPKFRKVSTCVPKITILEKIFLIFVFKMTNFHASLGRLYVFYMTEKIMVRPRGGGAVAQPPPQYAGIPIGTSTLVRSQWCPYQLSRRRMQQGTRVRQQMRQPNFTPSLYWTFYTWTTLNQSVIGSDQTILSELFQHGI